MAPITTASNEETHGALLDTLDLNNVPKPFRNPNYKPAQRRNKTLKQIQFLSEQLASAQTLIRDTQSIINTQQNSGANTPSSAAPRNDTSLSNLQGHLQQPGVVNIRQGSGMNTPTDGTARLPSVTYSSIAAAPSLKPKRKYCDITGMPAKYRDPQTGLFYYNVEVYETVKRMSTTQVQESLALRGAATVLK